jgi:uncharacterized protein YpbB
LTINEIAELKNVQASTVRNHIAKLIDEDMISTFANYITLKQYRSIIDYVGAHPDTYNKDLAEQYEPGLVQIALAISRYHDRNKR